MLNVHASGHPPIAPPTPRLNGVLTGDLYSQLVQVPAGRLELCIPALATSGKRHYVTWQSGGPEYPAASVRGKLKLHEMKSGK
ncbi:MAG: hypothetical protein R3E01_08565 [Pirellulaceae bacterium]|nr:hypothetical protein [Planctomycetales bacterium]